MSKHILVNTGGGDAPGLNAVIRAVVLAADQRGWKVTGIRRGYDGLFEDPEVGLVSLGRDQVRGIGSRGGTILGTRNSNPPHAMTVIENGQAVIRDRTQDVVDRLIALKADGLVAIGGDGSLTIAQRLFERGVPVVGVPKTIDNDLLGTELTFGFDTAVSVATDAIDRLKTTAESHGRIMVLEVMGRDSGWIALYAGVAAGADIILIPEIPFSLKPLLEKIRAREAVGKHYSIVVVAEGAFEKGGQVRIKDRPLGKEAVLGGIGDAVGSEIAQATGKESRCLVLGHLQRGGQPSHFDRMLATRMGAAAVRLIEAGEFGSMVALRSDVMTSYPIIDAIAERKKVPKNHDLVQTARDMGICLGDV
jgi:6-phosphofructokinase 1